MRVSDFKGVSVCCLHDTSNEYLNLFNIDQVFEKFYKDVPLPPYTPSEGGEKSYYTINMMELGIVKMDNHVKVSYKMTTSGDYDKWIAKSVLKIGDPLSNDHIQFLSNFSVADNIGDQNSQDVLSSDSYFETNIFNEKISTKADDESYLKIPSPTQGKRYCNDCGERYSWDNMEFCDKCGIPICYRCLNKYKNNETGRHELPDNCGGKFS